MEAPPATAATKKRSHPDAYKDAREPLSSCETAPILQCSWERIWEAHLPESEMQEPMRFVCRTTDVGVFHSCVSHNIEFMTNVCSTNTVANPTSTMARSARKTPDIATPHKVHNGSTTMLEHTCRFEISPRTKLHWIE